MTDRDDFMACDQAVTLNDGIVITLHDDPHGYHYDGDDPAEGTEYIGVTLEDPATDSHVGLWGIDVLPHQSGHDVRTMLWDDFLAGYYELLPAVRARRDHEIANRLDAAARDIMTIA